MLVNPAWFCFRSAWGWDYVAGTWIFRLGPVAINYWPER